MQSCSSNPVSLSQVQPSPRPQQARDDLGPPVDVRAGLGGESACGVNGDGGEVETGHLRSEPVQGERVRNDVALHVDRRPFVPVRAVALEAVGHTRASGGVTVLSTTFRRTDSRTPEVYGPISSAGGEKVSSFSVAAH